MSDVSSTPHTTVYNCRLNSGKILVKPVKIVLKNTMKNKCLIGNMVKDYIIFVKNQVPPYEMPDKLSNRSSVLPDQLGIVSFTVQQ